MNSDRTQGISSKLFALIFILILVIIFAAFVWFVQSANRLLPQDHEIISVSEAAEMIQADQVERVLIQRERDIFLYRSDEPRPYYTQLELGQVFTQTIESFGIPTERFPPVSVER
jgi:hypothetical protein